MNAITAKEEFEARKRGQSPEAPKDWIRTVALVASLSALCVATNYAMLPLPNINLMDSVVFVTGFCLGTLPGIAVASVSWLIYGTLNPQGFNLITLLTVTTSEGIYAVVGGGLSGSWLRPEGDALRSSFSGRNIGFGFVGLLATLAYDLITNAVTGWVFYGSVLVGLLTMNFPMPLGLIHEVSNLIFFALVVPPLIFSIERILGLKRVSFASASDKGGD